MKHMCRNIWWYIILTIRMWEANLSWLISETKLKQNCNRNLCISLLTCIFCQGHSGSDQKTWWKDAKWNCSLFLKKKVVLMHCFILKDNINMYYYVIGICVFLDILIDPFHPPVIFSEAVAQNLSVKKVFLKISENS